MRCCADASTTEAQLTGLSSRTCGELGWDPSSSSFDKYACLGFVLRVRVRCDDLHGLGYRFGHVCADSEVTSTDGEASCPAAGTPFGVAEQYCASLGARLCSVTEVEAEETRGTGRKGRCHTIRH